MKWSVFFFFLGVIQSFGSDEAYAQKTKLELNFNRTKLENVLNEIESKSEFYFLYNQDLINTNREVDIHVKGKKIDEVLNELFMGTDILFTIFDRQIVLTKNSDEASLIRQMAQQQGKKISGKVSDQTGAPLPGVSVVAKGTAVGVTTNVDGTFVLTIPDGTKTIVFSFVGMKSQEIVLGNKATFNITLEEESIGLDEVVAIGYGVQKKSNLTSSIAKISNQSIKERPITTMGEAFAGQLSGVRAQNQSGIPGSELTIKIRGVNTINGNSSPLYVIDGIPRENMTDINPSDVASIQVLKDASATSIYGSRGANGVILIETKQGTGNTAITIDSYYGLQDPVKMMDVMDGPEWAAFQTYARNETYLRSGGSMKDAMSKRPASLQIPASWTDGSRPSVDWQKAITQTAPIQSYQVSASSKTDKGSIYVSGGYLKQDGIILNTFYNRVNFRVNATLNAGEKIKLGVNIAPSFSNQADQNTQGKETTIHQAIMQPPLVQLNEGTVDFGYPTEFVSVYPNAVEKLKVMTDDTEKGKITSSIWAEYQILKGLSFKTQYSYDYRTEIYEYFYPAIERGWIPQGNSYTTRWSDWTFQNTLNYDFTIGKDHDINLLIGQSSDEHKYYNIAATATGFPNSLVRTLNVATTPTQAYTFKEKNTTASFFGRATYNFKDKYLFNASVRRDGSSRFGGNNKWGVFPAVSAGWKLNEESFMKRFDWLSLLKVRASWGMAGNDRIGNYDYMALLRVDNTSWNNAIQGGLAPNNIGNDNLQWETTTTTDFGLDVSVLKNRIQFNFDYYNNKTTDLLFNVPVPNSTGFSSFRTNLGEVQNKGWEVDINTRNTTGQLKWSTSLNLSANKNKVIDMGGIQQFTATNWDAQFITRVGGPVTQFYVYRTDGLLKPTDFDAAKKPLVPIMTGQVAGNVKYVDQNKDGVINSSDLAPYSSNLPDLIYGFTNRFEYKGFELSVLVQGQMGGKILWLGQRQMDVGNSVNNLKRWVHCWKPDYEAIYGAGENPIPSGVDMSWDGKTEYRLAGKNDNNTDLRIYDASFFKIKNISLTYNLPKGILGNSILKAAKVYVSIDNLATFDNYPGVTTESNTFGNETTQAGVDYTTYPLSKRYTLGVNITF
jgi:TonB-linked SusC/RagA family outer membrane protein